MANLSPKPYPVLCPSSATQNQLLQLLVQIAAENNLGVGVIVKIKLNIIASLYDYAPNLAMYVKPAMLQMSLDCIDEQIPWLHILTSLLRRTFWKRVRTYTISISHCVHEASS